MVDGRTLVPDINQSLRLALGLGEQIKENRRREELGTSIDSALSPDNDDLMGDIANIAKLGGLEMARWAYQTAQAGDQAQIAEMQREAKDMQVFAARLRSMQDRRDRISFIKQEINKRMQAGKDYEKLLEPVNMGVDEQNMWATKNMITAENVGKVAERYLIPAEPKKPTSLMQNVEAMGYSPGTPGYQKAIKDAVMKPQIAMTFGADGEQTKAPGMPTPSMAPWERIKDPKKRDDAKIRYGLAADKKLEKIEKDVNARASIKQDLERFVFLNESNETGPVVGSKPAVALRSMVDAEVAEMQSITDKMTPLMRQGLPGAASDRDVAMFRSGTVGVNKPEKTNINIATAMITAIQNDTDKVSFLRDYLTNYGHLNGAEKAWKQYLEANPIFDPTKPKGSYELNPYRKSYSEFFSDGTEQSVTGMSVDEMAELEALRKEQGK